MTPGVEDLWGDEIAVALEQGEARRRHVRRIASAFRAVEQWPVCGLAYRGLARFLPAWCHVREFNSMGMRQDHDEPWLPAPWGWCYRRVECYDARHLMPLWLRLVLDAWDWRWSLVRVAMWLRLWRVEQGDYYRNGYSPPWRKLQRIAWCFVNDRDRYELDV